MLTAAIYKSRLAGMNAIALAIERAGGSAKVAVLMGCSVQAVCFYRDGKRTFPVQHGAALEAASGVRRWEMWPQDWHRIWPELIGADGAPPVDAEAKAA